MAGKQTGDPRSIAYRAQLRPLGIVVLLVVSAGLVAILAFQAVSAASSHRDAVQEAMRNYSSLAGWEFMRRVGSNLSYPMWEGARLVRDVVDARDPTAAAVLPSPADLPVDERDRNQRVGRALMSWLFCVDNAGALTSEPGPSPPMRRWLAGDLRSELAERPRSERPYTYVAARTAGEAAVLVALPTMDDRTCGWALDGQALGRLLAASFEEGPLLPPALSYEEIGTDAVHVAVDDAAGRPLFRSPGTFHDYLAASGPLGNEIPGLHVRASIQPDAVRVLVAGGLPSPMRLPLLLGLLVVTVGLLATAIHQLRRHQELERLRSDFVSSVSHELRTPLTQIRMFTEMLRLGRTRGPEESARSLEIVDHESRRLTHLVENILQFSRAERGALSVAPEVIDLTRRVRDVVAAFMPLAREAGAHLNVEAPEAAVAARVDPDAFSQVVLNFLDNAIRYGPREQEIRVGLTPRDDAVEVWVEDQGPGVEEDDRERIWRRFERLASVDQGKTTGAGIGLAVVRDLVERHGGRAWVTAGRAGGARFVASFPPGLEGERRVSRILVVEDNENLALGLQANLEIEGHQVQVALTGEEGLEHAVGGAPDLIILDLMLPGMDGLQVLRHLRKQDESTPVLILTARGEEADKVQGLRLGADDYVTKPFGLMELLARVDALLRRAGRGSAQDRVEVLGDVEIDRAAREVRRHGKVVSLAPKEFDLLAALLLRKGQAVSRHDLMECVWGYADGVISRTVDTHIAELRRKLEDEPSTPRLIVTVRKVGYRLQEPGALHG